jgi:hypothetical protein
MYLRNALILLILIVSYAHGQISNVSNRADTSSPPLTVRTPAPIPAPLPAKTTIRGKAFYEDDKTPVRRSLIVFLKFRGNNQTTALTDEKGNFELENVEAGTYYPAALAPGAVNIFSKIDFSKIDEDEQSAFAGAINAIPEIVVDGNNDLDVEIPVKRGGAISGKVTYADGTPAIGCPIQIFRKVDGKLQPVISDMIRALWATSLTMIPFQTDDKGMYRFAGLPADEYYISVSEPAFHTKNSSAFPLRGPDYVMSFLFGGNTFLSTFFPNTVEIKDAQPIKIELDTEKSDADIKIPDWKLFNISGKVISAKDGKPVKARVYAVNATSQLLKLPSSYPSRASSAYSQTDENGNWEFSNIPRGRYTVFVEPLDQSYRDAVMSGGTIANATNVTATVTNSSRNMSNTASNQISGTIKVIPKPKYAKTSYDVVVENSDVENVSIKTDLEAVVKGTAEFEVRAPLDGRVRIETYNEAGVLVEKDILYLYDSDKYVGKIWKQNFIIDNLPKGKLKIKIFITGDNVYLKSATFNGIDLQQNSFAINAGQTLDNFKLIFGTKQP